LALASATTPDGELVVNKPGLRRYLLKHAECSEYFWVAKQEDDEQLALLDREMKTDINEFQNTRKWGRDRNMTGSESALPPDRPQPGLVKEHGDANRQTRINRSGRLS
jgi:hypothetical protein